MKRRFRFGPLRLKCRKCDYRWKPAKMGIRQKCPRCEHQRVEMETQQALEAAAGDEDDVEDAEDGELIDARTWTDAGGRTMNASLRTVMKDSAGYFVGFFVRDDGVGFQYPIGKLSPADVELVRGTMIEKDLYSPEDVA